MTLKSAHKSLLSKSVALLLAVLGGTALAATPSTVTNTSVSMAENAQNYIITATGPDKDTELNLKLEGQTLHLISGEAGSAHYEQNIYLPDADTSKQPEAKHEKNQLVITVPKLPPGSVPQKAAAPVSNALPVMPATPVAPSLPSAMPQSAMDDSDEWEKQAMAQMLQMQKQMAKMASGMMQNFNNPNLFANALGGGFGGMPFSPGNSVRMEEMADRYVVSMQVSPEEAKNVDVTVTNGRVLKITSKQEASNGGKGMQSYQSSSSTQMLTLPGPVKTQKVTTDYKDGNLLIELPKA